MSAKTAAIAIGLRLVLSLAMPVPTNWGMNSNVRKAPHLLQVIPQAGFKPFAKANIQIGFCYSLGLQPLDFPRRKTALGIALTNKFDAVVHAI